MSGTVNTNTLNFGQVFISNLSERDVNSSQFEVGQGILDGLNAVSDGVIGSSIG